MKTINNYDIFYSYKTIGDTLIVSIFSGQKDRIVTKGMVEVCYCNNEITTIRFNGISKLIKIHSNGLMPLPNELFVDILNNVLKKENLDIKLAYKTHSNYVIGRVIDNNIINIGSENIELHNNLNTGDLVVIALPNTRLATGVWTSAHHICTYIDLHINNSTDVLIIDENYKPGTDFFKMEEK